MRMLGTLSEMIRDDGENTKSDVEKGTYAETGLVANNVSRRKGCGRSIVCILGIVVIILLLFPVVTIPILFTLYSRRKMTQQSSAISASFLAATTTSTPEVGGASLTSRGVVQAGGGTTIYKNVGTIPLDSCPKFLSGTAVFDDKFLVSFVDSTTGIGSLNVMQVDASRKAVNLASNTTAYDLYHVVTLNQATGLFVSISQAEYLPPNLGSAIIAGKVNPNSGYSITFGPHASYIAEGNNSVDPSLTALSNTTFAISYYLGTSVYTRYGTVDPMSLQVNLSPPLYFANNSAYVMTMAITDLSPTEYVIIYNNYGPAPNILSAVVMTGSVDGTGKALVSSSAVNNFNNYVINGFFKATTLTKSASGMSEVIIAYIDSSSHMGVTCTSLAVNATSGIIRDGSSLPITTGASATAYSSISIVTIGTGSQFMVVFIDILLKRAVVTAIGQSTKTELIRVSPNYIMNAGSAEGSNYYTFLSLAVSSATPHFSRVAILSSVTDIQCKHQPVSDFSFMEVLPKPLGVMTTSGEVGTFQSVSVALSGVASGFSNLVVGETYYTTTSGKLVTDGSFYGVGDATSSNNGIDGFFYVNDVSDNLMVSSESILGVAVAADSILIKSA